LWDKVEGNNILDIGVGTGQNIPFYPQAVQITAIDFSRKMSKHAENKAGRENIQVDLKQVQLYYEPK